MIKNIFSNSEIVACTPDIRDLVKGQKYISPITDSAYELDPLRTKLQWGCNISSVHELPKLNAYIGSVPVELLSYRRCLRLKKYHVCGHGYVEDKYLAIAWNKPIWYASKLSLLDCVIEPNFSLREDYSYPQVITNLYKKRLLAAYWQKEGMMVIPDVAWHSKYIDVCIEGCPKNSIITINSTGVCQDKKSVAVWKECYSYVVDTLSPIHIIRYGGILPEERADISTYFTNDNKKACSYGS